MAAVSYLLQNGSGFVFQVLLTDLMALIILGYISITTVFPFVKKALETRKIAKEIGSTKSHWFWGDILKYGFNHDGLKNCVNRCLEFPAMCTFYLGFKPTFHCYHPDVNKTILTCTTRKSWVYQQVMSIVLGSGLLTANPDVWKIHRKLITPIFHFDILKEHCLTFSKNVLNTMKTFDKFADSERLLDVVPLLSSLAYSNMMESVMSQSAMDDNGQTSVFIPAAKTLNKLLIARQQNPLHWNEKIYKLTKNGKRLLEERVKIHDESHRIIKERRALLNSISNNADNDGTNTFTDSSGKTFTFKKRRGKIMDFLDILLQSKDENGVGLTDDEIADEVITFFLAGMETAANNMLWLIFFLSTNEDCQDKCRNELAAVLGDKENIEMSDLNKLPYFNQCVKESLRLCCPAHVIARELEEDTAFSHRFNNYKKIVLKKGTPVIINIFATHRNPSVWDNPEVYDPERFNANNITKIPNFAYIPFAAGPRNCIGLHLALAEVKVTIAQLVRHYQFSWDPETPHPRLKVGVTLQPDGPLPLRVKRI